MIQTRHRQIKRLTWSVRLKLPSLTMMNPKNVLWLFCLLYLTGTAYLMMGPLFRIHRYVCVTGYGEPCPDFVVPELMKHQDKLIFFVQTELIETHLKANVPTAEIVRVSRKFPDILETTITRQAPIANLSIPASTSAYLVGTNGDLIGLLSEPDPALPVIVASSAADLIISDHLTDVSLKAALDIIHLLADTSQKPGKIDVISSQDIRVDLSNNMLAVFTSLKPVRPQVRTLQLILSQTTMNQGWSVIDLRYDRPTLKKSL